MGNVFQKPQGDEAVNDKEAQLLIPPSVDELISRCEREEALFLKARKVYKKRQEVAEVIVNFVLIVILFVWSFPFSFEHSNEVKEGLPAVLLPIAYVYLNQRKTHQYRELTNDAANVIRSISSRIEFRVKRNQVNEQFISECTHALVIAEDNWKQVFGENNNISDQETVDRLLQEEEAKNKKKLYEKILFPLSGSLCDCCERRQPKIPKPNDNNDPVLLLQYKIAKQGQLFTEHYQHYRRCFFLFLFLSLLLTGLSVVATCVWYYEKDDKDEDDENDTNEEETFHKNLIRSSVLPFVSFFWCFYFAGWRWYVYSSMSAKNAKLKKNVEENAVNLTTTTIQVKEDELQDLFDECNRRWASHHGVENKVLTKIMEHLKNIE